MAKIQDIIKLAYEDKDVSIRVDEADGKYLVFKRDGDAVAVYMGKILVGRYRLEGDSFKSESVGATERSPESDCFNACAKNCADTGCYHHCARVCNYNDGS